MTAGNKEYHRDLPIWLALRRAGLGTSMFTRLLAAFGDASRAWEASPGELKAAGIGAQYVRSIEKARTGGTLDSELELVEQHGIRVLTWLDDDFPVLLRDIPQSPPVLYVRGNGSLDGRDGVAIVGTRRVTAYGRSAAEEFATAICRAGLAVISGLARGVDAVAHRAALDAGGETIAVLAGGVETVFPRENAGLGERILEHGCLVSEYPIGTPARADFFPRRNRILSGLARSVLVVEAGQGSGALHTANWAFEQGRDVFAIPGSIYSKQSEATNQLIRENTAKLVVSPEQLLEELNLLEGRSIPQPRLLEESAPVAVAPRSEPKTKARTAAPPAAQAPLAEQPPEVAAILVCLQEEPRHVDEIVRASGLDVPRVTSLLQILELEGKVRLHAPLTYVQT